MSRRCIGTGDFCRSSYPGVDRPDDQAAFLRLFARELYSNVVHRGVIRELNGGTLRGLSEAR